MVAWSILLQRRLRDGSTPDEAQRSKRARAAAESWHPADVVAAMAPNLAAGSPEAPELFAKLVVVAPRSAANDRGDDGVPLVSEWLRAKLAAPQNGGLLRLILMLHMRSAADAMTPVLADEDYITCVVLQEKASIRPQPTPWTCAWPARRPAW